MGVLLDHPEKYELAARQPVLGVPSHNPGNSICIQHDRAGLAAVDFDDQVLIAPDRNEETAGIGQALDNPCRVAAAETGALKAGM